MPPKMSPSTFHHPYFRSEAEMNAYMKRDDVIDAYTLLVLDAFKPHPLVMSAIVKADTEEAIKLIKLNNERIKK